VIFSNYQAVSQVVSEEWSAVYSVTSQDDDESYSMAIDNDRFVYVTGYSNLIGNDIFTIKYDPNNGQEIWTNRYNGTGNGNDRGHKIAVDGLGNIYITGYSANTGTGTSDMTTIKYSSNGNQLWIRNYNGPVNGTDVANCIAIDVSNNIYITGYSAGSGTGTDYTTLKYAPNGALQWARRYNGTGNGNDEAKWLEIDKNGNVCVTGFSAGIGTGASDFTTIKYSPSGDSIWVKRYNGSANGIDQATSIDSDSLGNVYVSGYTAETGTGASDYAVIKYSPAGVLQWVRNYNGTGNGEDHILSMIVDNIGNTIVTGYSLGVGTGNDYVTIKYNSSGDTNFVRRFQTTGDDVSRSVTYDVYGNIYVTGNSNNSFTTLKYNSIGNTLWMEGFSYYDYAQANQVLTDGTGNVYVTGAGRQCCFDWITIRYSEPFVRVMIEGLYDQFTDFLKPDTVRVYLRNSTSPFSIVDSAITYLDSIGYGIIKTVFQNADPGQYFISLRHRNSIETWSRLSMKFPFYGYNFTTSASQAYGDNQILKGTRYCIYSGDVNQDGIIDATDMQITDNDAFISTGGYVVTDVNGDYFVDGSDLLIIDNNANMFIEAETP